MSAVVAQGLTKRFGETEALRGVDFEIERGKVLGLLGPNGAGETTEARILCTLLKPDGGRAFIVAQTVLLLGFAYACTWIFPLTFVSSAFVDPRTMPSWLQPFTRNNPFTIATNAVRALYNGKPAGSDLWLAVAWAVGITIVFAILASRKFTASTR